MVRLPIVTLAGDIFHELEFEVPPASIFLRRLPSHPRLFVEVAAPILAWSDWPAATFFELPVDRAIELLWTGWAWVLGSGRWPPAQSWPGEGTPIANVCHGGCHA